MFIKQFDIVRLKNVCLISIVLTKSLQNFFSLYGFFLQCLYVFLRKSSGNTGPDGSGSDKCVGKCTWSSINLNQRNRVGTSYTDCEFLKPLSELIKRKSIFGNLIISIRIDISTDLPEDDNAGFQGIPYSFPLKSSVIKINCRK